jgi:fumarate reductase flavoprotein subunit
MSEKQEQVSRRDFLKKGAAIGVAAASMGVLTACTTQDEEGSSAIDWDYSADVVIVGSGSGLFAAVEAAEAGASVILLEKGPVLGGCMTINGAWYTGAGSAAQKRAGITDSAEAYWKQWQLLYGVGAGSSGGRIAEWAALANLDMIKLWIDNSGATIDRLEELGMEFVVIQEPNVQEVPRSHIVQPNVSAYVGTLRPVAEQRGVEIMTETPGIELITQADKTVLGVKAQSSTGKTLNIQAKKGVLLATGDTSGNEEFLRKNYSESLASIPACWPLNTADGLIMAKAIGADSSEKSLLTAPMLWDPMSSFADSTFVAKGSIYVDKTAKRFCSELASVAPILLNAREDKTCYTIFSQDSADIARRPASISDIAADHKAGKSAIIGSLPGSGFGYIDDYLEGKAPIVQADTIEDLASKLGLDPNALKATVDTWNASVAAGQDAEFNRPLGVTGTPGVSAQFGATVGIETPPFYALQTNSVALMVTEGPSLIIDQEMKVLDVYGNPIPRLYACGAGVAGGIPIMHLQHGEHAGFSLVSARIAAKTIVAAASVE